jgi:hypothetical protein
MVCCDESVSVCANVWMMRMNETKDDDELVMMVGPQVSFVLCSVFVSVFVDPTNRVN